MVIRNNTQTLTHTHLEKKEGKEGKGGEKRKERNKTHDNLTNN